MNSKYEELENWKKLKDSGDITEEEFYKEKQRILNSTESTNEKKKYKVNYVMTAIIVVNIVLLICNGIFRIGKIGEKEYSITKNNYGDKTTLKINEFVINKGVKALEKSGMIISNDMYVVYSLEEVKQYVVFAYYNSLYENTTFSEFYYMIGIDAKTGETKTIESASKLYGKDYVVAKALSSSNLASGNVGLFKYKVDYNNKKNNVDNEEPSGQQYVAMAIVIIVIGAIIYVVYKKLKRKSNIVTIIGLVFILIQLLWIKPYIKFNKSSNNENTKNTTTTASDTKITGIEQAIKDGNLNNIYMDEGITEGKLRVEYYEGKLENYYNSFEDCLADAKKIKILVDSSKFSNLTGIERAIKDGAIGDDYITEGITKQRLLEALDGNLGIYYGGDFEKCLEDAKKLNILKETTDSLKIGRTYKFSDNSCEMSITILDDKNAKLDGTMYGAENPKMNSMTDEVYPYEVTYTVSDGVMWLDNEEQDKCSILEDGTIEFRGVILK